jgi:hypothetical protein
MSLEVGDVRYPPDSRVAFEDGGSAPCWMSAEDVAAIQRSLPIALAAIAVAENDPSWLRESLMEQLSIDDKRRYVEFASVLLGKPRRFGWHRHEEVNTRLGPPPDWDELIGSGQLTDVTRRAHIHGYVILASSAIAVMSGTDLQDIVVKGIAELRAGGSDQGFASWLYRGAGGGGTHSSMNTILSLEVHRVRDRVVVLGQAGEFGPFVEVLGHTVEYRRRSAEQCRCRASGLEGVGALRALTRLG